MQATQMLAQAVALSRDRVAMICGERRRTWGEIAERVPRIAGGLRALGVGRADRIAVLAMNSDRYVEVFFAAPWSGAACVPLNIRWSSRENEYAIKDAGCRLLFADDDFIAQARELKAACPTLEHLIHIGDGPTPPGMRSYEDMASTHAPVEDAGMQGDDLYVVFYTGGTTGYPKGVALSHHAIVYSTICYLAMLPTIEDLRFLYVGGFFHFSGASPMWYVTMAGGTHVILPKFEVVPVMRAIGEHRVTNATLIPTMVTMMMGHPDFARHDFSSMRTCIYGGAPMPEALIMEAMKALPTWSFYQIYGMTETGGFATMLRWRDHVLPAHGGRHLKSAGQAAIGVQVKIRRPDRSVAPAGEVGEITVRSDALMTGYFGNPDATGTALVDGWMYTGDAGWMDEDGYLFIADRIKDMIVSGGENVYSVEVERALFLHPAVREAAVIGVPSDQWGEAVHAVVVLRDGMSSTYDELFAHCRSLIAGYKCPRSIEFRRDPLPVTPVGKVRKNVLRDPYWSERERKV